MLTPFHVAVPVRDLNEARHFYGTLLGFPEGRSSSHWIDFNLFGHQFVVHLDENIAQNENQKLSSSVVDNQQVPVPHFGVVLSFEDWQRFSEKVKQVIPEYIKILPTIRFQGQAAEQGTLFFTDPSGNALEFKGFRDIEGSLFNKSK